MGNRITVTDTIVYMAILTFEHDEHGVRYKALTLNTEDCDDVVDDIRNYAKEERCCGETVEIIMKVVDMRTMTVLFEKEIDLYEK